MAETRQKIRLRESMWAEMAPDLYSGENCDEQRPQWRCLDVGGKGDSDELETLKLAANTFPPGTIVSVTEPVCPECGNAREPNFPINHETGPTFVSKCDCGFDWDRWVGEEYA